MSWYDRPLPRRADRGAQASEGQLVHAPAPHLRRACAGVDKTTPADLREAPLRARVHLPGGRHAKDSAEEAGLRELSEETGMTWHGRVRLACELEQRVDLKRDISALLIVEDLHYEPGWSYEVEQVGEYPFAQLPDDTSPPLRERIAAVRDRI